MKVKVTKNKSDQNYEKLKSLVIGKESLPFLFIGSGFSRRYLNSPNWDELLKHFCTLIDNGKNKYLFNLYRERAKQINDQNGIDPSSKNLLYSKIADLIEADFNLVWFQSDTFENSRTINEKYIEKGYSPFKIEISNYFSSCVESSKSDFYPETEVLKKLSKNSIAGIITTNFDCLIERFFDLEVYVGQEELLFSNSLGLDELYKIHGCCSDPESIIINSKDYTRIKEKNKYLAAKLLTIFVEHPIIFIGYSITDEDVRDIIDSILDCLNEKQLLEFKQRFIFIDWIFDVEEEPILIDEFIYSSSTGKSITMTKVRLKEYSALYDVLSQNTSKYPIKFMRKLKEDIYNLTLNVSPSKQLEVMLPMSILDDPQKYDLDNIQYVMGVGIADITKQAYSTFTAEEIYLDIVFDNQQFIPNLLVDKTLPTHLSRTAGSLPFYKYLTSYDGDYPEIYHKYRKKNIEDFYSTMQKRSWKSQCENSILDITCIHPDLTSIKLICDLNPKNVELYHLKQYLLTLLTENKDLVNRGTKYSSNLRKLIKIYDWLSYYKKCKNFA